MGCSILTKKNKKGYELEYIKKQRLNLGWKRSLVSFFQSGFYELGREIWFQLRKNFSNRYYNINPYRHGFLIRSKIKRLRRKNLIIELNRNKDVLNLSEKYVYFGLHFEPERTTNPDGGKFHDQALAIIALRKILPSSINIIVKEHPSQFYIYDRGSRGRSPLFYDLIKNISGVQLASHREESFKLIRGAEFISTIAGTLALEAAILGKKSLIFGDSWFQGCPNVFSWSDALTYNDISQQKILDPNSILNFLLKQKKLKTVIGCQNISAQTTYKEYLINEKFSRVEFSGVTHLLEKLFSNLNTIK